MDKPEAHRDRLQLIMELLTNTALEGDWMFIIAPEDTGWKLLYMTKEQSNAFRFSREKLDSEPLETDITLARDVRQRGYLYPTLESVFSRIRNMSELNDQIKDDPAYGEKLRTIADEIARERHR